MRCSAFRTWKWRGREGGFQCCDGEDARDNSLCWSRLNVMDFGVEDYSASNEGDQGCGNGFRW